MTKSDWVKLVEELEQSGLSVSKFADMKGVKPKTLNWWRWKTSRTNASPGHVPGSVTGVRQACAVLGVSKFVLQRRINKMTTQPSDQDPVWGISSVGQKGLTWRDEKHLRAWFYAVQPVSSRKAAKEDKSQVRSSIGSELGLKAIIGDDLYGEMVRIRNNFNALPAKRLRAMRGETEEVTMEEVVTMVLGVGLMNWTD